jgi:hypothetical protein
MTIAHTISTDPHRCVYCWSAIRAGDLHRAYIDNEPDEGDEHDLTAERDDPHPVTRAHLGCEALAGVMYWGENECVEHDPWDSIREALDHHYGLRSPDFVPTLRRLLGEAATKTYHHANAEFARLVKDATRNDLRRIEVRYFPKPPHRDRADVAEVREAAHAELMETVESIEAMKLFLYAYTPFTKTPSLAPPSVGKLYDKANAADKARDAAVLHTDAMLAKHDLPPRHRHESRRQMLTSLLGKIQPKEPTP